MIACEREFLKVHGICEQLVESVRRAGQEGRRIDDVERMVFAEVLAMGRHLMTAHVASAGDGDEGQTIDVPAVAEETGAMPDEPEHCRPADLPTLTKAEMMAHFDEIVTDRRVSRAGLERFIAN